MVKIRPLKIQTEIISSFIGQAIGFMFHPAGKKAKLFEFGQERQAEIHMLFVFFPLIVVWLNKSRKVKHFEIMYPFSSFASYKAKYVLEIPYNAKLFKKIKLNKTFSW